TTLEGEGTYGPALTGALSAAPVLKASRHAASARAGRAMRMKGWRKIRKWEAATVAQNRATGKGTRSARAGRMRHQTIRRRRTCRQGKSRRRLPQSESLRLAPP